ncbi:glycerophosphodiester phosphodiesterase family protein [Tamlana sp. 62-3]|uniref:Glycerophosphodiester phosphodiesterase family protein n=1 Tax=Neotamlana sargassicola TaxID=2883125 RepID=A0A9X1I7I7_9FLAO|nr:glycerophosphodiester phosphodiesterase family protein [Tamlana sargassicola]MCB4809265.1 glycerophosphodiester phosphodiesterase family protein [Tamlana sargassicola]
MKYLFVLFLLVSVSCKQAPKQEEQPEKTKPSVLLSKFSYSTEASTLVSVHRGGKNIKNYPENCLETIQFINDSIKGAIYEIDVALTKDSVLVLMHDNAINRTSTGNGKVSNFTYKELLQYNLKDDFGNETSFKIPLFKDVLQWAKTNNVILTVDIKRGVSVKKVVNQIKEIKAEDIAIIITYNLDQATAAYKEAPELLLSVSARNEKELDWLIHSGIPTQNMLAFTGTRLSPNTLYSKIHDYGIKTILGTLGNLDKQASAKNDSLYRVWSKKGIDIIATDRPFEAYNAIKN